MSFGISRQLRTEPLSNLPPLPHRPSAEAGGIGSARLGTARHGSPSHGTRYVQRRMACLHGGAVGVGGSGLFDFIPSSCCSLCGPVTGLIQRDFWGGMMRIDGTFCRRSLSRVKIRKRKHLMSFDRFAVHVRCRQRQAPKHVSNAVISH